MKVVIVGGGAGGASAAARLRRLDENGADRDAGTHAGMCLTPIAACPITWAV